MGRLLTLWDDGGGFDPRSIPNLALWLDAADLATLTFNSTTISQWNDKSGNNNHAIQATALRQPLYVANAIGTLPALKFRHDGTNGTGLTVADSASLVTPTISIFAVVQRHIDMAADEEIIWKTAAGPNYEYDFRIHSSDVPLATYSTDGAAAAVFPVKSGALAVGTRYILETYYDGANAFAGTNGVLGTGSALAGTQFNGTNDITIGGNSGFGVPLAAFLGELLIYKGSLTATQRLSNLLRLATKWGIAI